MAKAKSTVLVIDDDPDVRASVGRLLRSLGIDVQLFASIPDFLKSDPPNGPTCLSRSTAGARPGKKGTSDHLHHRARRHSNVGASDEGGRHRVPDQAIPRSGPPRCYSGRPFAPPCMAGK